MVFFGKDAITDTSYRNGVKGLVIKNTGSWYQVRTEDERFIDCKIKGSFRLKDIKTTNPIAIGDRVIVEENPQEEVALITAIEDRKNYIIRRSSNLSKQAHIIAANIDQAFLMVTVNYPVTTSVFIDRFLVTAEAYHIPVSLLFNKIDRYKKAEQSQLEELIQVYEPLGYSCRKLSARHDESIEELEALLKDKITLFSGHSGVGKSTLINRILPGAGLKTADISEYHNKGTHTTTFSEMISLPSGGYIIDTPGIKGFGLVDMDEAEISHYFPEIFKHSEDCRFNNCTHRREPDCAVVKAVSHQEIALSRYNSYISILNDLHDGKYREAF